MSTISTHFGHQVSTEHNRRNRRVTDKESHIDPSGHYEIWLDIPPREAYERLFGEAVKEYNEKQKREDRKIRSYYNQISKDARKHPVYEAIVGVYGAEVDFETSRSILKEYADEWEKVNPNMVLCGVYYHADEAGQDESRGGSKGRGHIHIDFIPISHGGLHGGYKKGLSVQTSLTKGLEEQGIVNDGRRSAQEVWTRSENERLERICRAHGITVEHPQRDQGVEHKTTELYKAEKSLEQKKSKLKELEQQTKEAEKSMDAVKSELESAKDDLLTLKNQAALSRAVQEAYKEPEHPVEILEQYPEKKTISGKTVPASVRITKKDFDDLNKRAMASDRIKKALFDLKTLGDRLFKAMDQRQRVAALKKEAEDARASERMAQARLDTLMTENHQKDQYILEAASYLEEMDLWDRFINWLSQHRAQKEREVSDLTAEIDNPDRER